MGELSFRLHRSHHTSDCYTSFSIEKGFAIQVVSRFALAYLLTSRGVLAPSASVLSVANVGNSLDDLQVDDLNLTKKLGAGRWKLPLLIDQSKRDSSVLDAFHLVRCFQSRFGLKGG